MPSGYTCVRCGYQTFKRSIMSNHLKRKIMCKPRLSDCDPGISVEIIEKKHICHGCKKSFTRKCNLTKHLNKCGATDRRILELQAEVDELRQRQSAQTINNNTNSHNTTNNNITNNITMVSHSKTPDPFDDDDILDIMAGPDYRDHPVIMFKMKHCNPDLPDNRNIAVTNLKSPYIHFYEDGEWDVGTKKKMCANIAYDNMDKADLVVGNISEPYTPRDRKAMKNSHRFRYIRYNGPEENMQFLSEMIFGVGMASYRNRGVKS